MGIRKRKPTSPGRRFQTVSDFADITKSTPEKSLLAKKTSAGGRNVYGRVTSRHQGGGHKQQYRIIDFKRNYDQFEAKVAAIEYDPNRTCRIALLHYADGSKAYILAPKGLEVGMRVQSGPKADIKVGNALPLRYLPVGTVIHNIELRPGQGGKVGRSAGMAVQLVAKKATSQHCVCQVLKCVAFQSIAVQLSAKLETQSTNSSRSVKPDVTVGRAFAHNHAVL